jgi:hypothetical protein
VDRGAARLRRGSSITYSLIQLGPGAYDLLLNGEVMGSIVRNGSRQPYTLTAELLEDLPRSKRPVPFKEIEHDFPTLEELRAWLGDPEVKSNFGKSLEVRRT